MRGFSQNFLTILLILGSANLWAQTVDDFIKIALERNPYLQSLRSQIASDQNLPNQVGYLPNPSVSIMWFGESVQTKTGPQEIIVGVKQAIPWPSRLKLQETLATSQSKLSQWDLKNAEIELNAQIKNLFVEHSFIEQKVQLFKESISLLEQQISLLQNRLEVGRAKVSSVLKLEDQISLRRESILQQQDQQLQIRIQLSSLWNNTLPSPISDLRTESHFIYAEDSLIKLEQHPSVQKLLQMQTLAQQKGELAQSQNLPNFGIGFNYIVIGENPSNGQNGSNPWNIGLNLTLPIYQAPNHAKVQASKEKIRKVDWMIKNFKTQRKSQIAQNHEWIKQIKRTKVLYLQELIPRSQKLLTLAIDNFSSGLEAFSEIINRENELVKLKIKLLEQDHLLQKKEIEFRRLLGL